MRNTHRTKHLEFKEWSSHKRESDIPCDALPRKRLTRFRKATSYVRTNQLLPVSFPQGCCTFGFGYHPFLRQVDNAWWYYHCRWWVSISLCAQAALVYDVLGRKEITAKSTWTTSSQTIEVASRWQDRALTYARMKNVRSSGAVFPRIKLSMFWLNAKRLLGVDCGLSQSPLVNTWYLYLQDLCRIRRRTHSMFLSQLGSAESATEAKPLCRVTSRHLRASWSPGVRLPLATAAADNDVVDTL